MKRIRRSKRPVRRAVFWGPILLASLLGAFVLVRLGLAGNTHSGTGDVATEQRAWWGDAATGYVKHGCLHGTSGTTSASIASCRAYVLSTDLTPRQLEYVEDLTARTITYSSGDGTYWLIAYATTSGAVSGWTRQGITHYLWQKLPTQPALPPRAAWLARITVLAGDITVVTDWRSSNPFQPHVFRVTDHLWGAVPNDNTNDLAAIQAAMTAAQRGNIIIDFPPGVYDCDGDNLLAIQGVWGTNTCLAVHGASDVVVRGYGATLRAGSSTIRLFGIYDSTRVTVEGLHFIGHTQTISQQKHALVVGHNSHHVTIRSNYITNFFGDAISVDGNLSNGTLTGFTSTEVKILQNTLKERYGNGTSSALGGTKSRLAISVIDARYVTIAGNTIFGGVDIEPNVNGQYLHHVTVTGNTFHEGPLTPQATIGTTYYHDEPIVAPGSGTLIEGAITLTGVAASPIVSEVYFRENTFGRGVINCTVSAYVCGIVGNTFTEGLIMVGDTSGPGTIAFAHVANNATKAPYPGQTTFIRLNGVVTFGSFLHNIAEIAGGYIIDDNGASTGDGGQNIWLGNFNRSVTAAGQLGFAVSGSSIAGGF